MGARIETEIKINKYIENKILKYPEYIEEWHLNLDACNDAATTRREYLNKVTLFFRWLNDNYGISDIKEINLKMLQKYFVSIQTKIKDGKIVYTTDSHKLGTWIALENFFSYMFSRGYVEQNYLKFITKPKNHDLRRIKQNRKPLTQEDFKLILDKIKNDGAGSNRAKSHQKRTKIRDLAMVSLLMNTGIRETAFTEINIDDLDLTKRELHVVDKGDKTHIFYINDENYNYLNEWIKIRNNIIKDHPTDALFISEKNNRISQSALSDVIEKYSQSALGIKLTPHKIRGGLINIIYDSTGSITEAQNYVGHSDPSTTNRYMPEKIENKKKLSATLKFGRYS